MTCKIKFKHGRYYAIFRYYENDRRKERWFALDQFDQKNHKEAYMELQTKKDDLIDELETQDTFIGYLKSWIKYKRNFIEKSTWESYCMVIDKHIIPYFSRFHFKLTDIKPRHIRDYYQYMHTQGRVDGKGQGLSIATLVKHSIIFKGVFDEAVLDEYIAVNPAARVKMPAINTPSVKPNFLTSEQAKELLQAFENTRLYSLVYVTLSYGLRRSEVLGLRWRAIDFENNTITINHAVVKNLTIEAKDTTKTENSMATYNLMDNVKQVLLEQKAYQDHCKEVMKSAYKDNDYVFTWENGKLYLPDYITRTFQKVLKEHNLPVMRFHDLRHSTASLLYDNGMSLKDVQMWMRHANIDTTSDIYTHITENRKLIMSQNISTLFDNMAAK